MRTTLTIDDGLFEALKTEALRRRRPFKDVVNDTLRRGMVAEHAPRAAYHLPVVDLGHPPKMELDQGLRLADSLEDDEIQRKLHVKK